MKKVLVVWSEIQIPSPPTFVVLDVDDSEIKKFERFNGHYINSTESINIAAKMSLFFYENGSFKFPVSNGPLTDKYDLIIHCGIIV